MTLLLLGEFENPEIWISALKTDQPELKIEVYPNFDNLLEIDAVLVWMHPLGVIEKFPNLKIIISTGAGVDHILRDPNLPPNIPIVRLVDESLTAQMSEYILLAILQFHRQFIAYQIQQNQQLWQGLPPRNIANCTVGILGLGVLGLDIAQKLKLIGFSVRGWSRTPKRLDNINCFSGKEEFNLFLSECSVLVCLLPLTPETEGILNQNTFAALPPGAYLINVARGKHLVEEDLLTALTSGQLSGACLDVFQNEPLPKNHPFWVHSKVIITPHIAAKTIPACVAPQIIEALQKSQEGLPLNNTINVSRGY
ncbi:Glyoxylate/hydroxypyruvate reductase A [Planktothrix serta PCC 8927]|uniref:Glyoxylate/hydroxypyruvate reductase A n=1 Tax=Planktothrix serta PCC 8927 TaxID=671068 RepID=A0A7Z9BL76_9CYAN|nr:glyoxylate/hydroxypyruvate reductase A [Planktothrix serta]VXD16662.1 Glyoxylate/hydroxypyruvate reductase A [Planktothrix serta PCC 8927]